MAEPSTPQVSEEDVGKILDTIKEIESGGNYSTRSRASSASGAYQFIDNTWKRFTNKYGVGTEYKTAAEAPPEVQDEVAALKVRDILKQVGGDVTKVPLVWYTGNPQGRLSEEAIKANQGMTPDKYQQRWMAAFNKRQEMPAPTPVVAQTGPVDQGPRASIDALPQNYRLALAANYIADTEPDSEKSIADKAMEYLEQYTQSQEGGATNIKKALGATLTDQGPNPFEILSLAQKAPQEKKRALPRMPVKFADGGLIQRALISNQPRLSSTDYNWLQQRQAEFNTYNTAVDAYQKAIDDYNAKVEAYNAAQGVGVANPGEFTTAAPTLPSTTVEEVQAYQQAAQQRAVENFQNRAIAYEALLNPQKYNLSGLSFSFAGGGEVNLEEDEARKKSQEMLFNLRANMGPVTGQFVPSPQGIDIRGSIPIGPVRGYVDVSPADQEITQVGATYGDMGPQGGYEVGVSQRAPMETPAGKVRMPVVAQGVYRMPVGKTGSFEAQGYYTPRQGEMPGSAYGANLRYRMNFATGGSVDYNQAAEQMTVGTLPEDQKPAGQVFRDIGRDVVRGAQYLPYDLIGAPVDIATMAMRPFGYTTEKPFLGSEWLIDKAAQAGIADRPTGSAAETATRIGMGFVNPAAGARQVGRGLQSLERVVTAPIDRAKISAAAAKVPEEAAYAPLRERLESQGIVSLATRPLGSAINTQPEVMKLRQAVKEELNIVPLPETFNSEEARAFQESYYAAKEKYGPQMEAIEKTLIPKLENYFTRQYGTVNDPLYQATLNGKYMPRAFYSPNATFRWDKNAVVETTGLPPTKDNKLNMEHVNKLQELSAQGNKQAQSILGKAYDLADRPEAFLTSISIAESLKNPQNFSYMVERLKSYGVKNPEDVIKTYVSESSKTTKYVGPQEDNFFKLEAIAVTKYDADTRKLLEEQAKNLSIPSLSPNSRMPTSVYPFKYLTEKTQQEIMRGKPMYQTNNLFGQNIDYRDIVDYVLKAPLDKWQKMSVPELVIASHVNPANVTSPSKVARMADDGVELLPFQKIMGTTEYMPVKSKMLGDGAQWREITTKEGMRIEGGLMDHCLKKDRLGYCNRLLNKESKYFTLRDADGHPYVSIEMTKPMGQEKQDVPFNVIRQVKGYLNGKAVPAYGDEISDFLTAWENQIGVKLRPAENADYLPEKFKPQQFGIQTPPENMAKGGMVDKPLYDRAA